MSAASGLALAFSRRHPLLMTTAPATQPVTGVPAHAALRAWVEEMVQLCQPDSGLLVRRQRGGKGARSPQQAVEAGVLIQLNQEKLPGCYLHRSNPNDVARVEDCTFICTRTPDAAGPTNNWMAPRRDVREALRPLPRRDEGPHDVRRALPHGHARLAAGQGRRGADRLASTSC